MTGSMGFHLPTVLATPTALALIAVVATWLWPHRAVLWALLLPAWLLAAAFFGLLACRDELAGPVLQWCRPDAFGIVATMLAMPLGAITQSLARNRASTSSNPAAAPTAPHTPTAPNEPNEPNQLCEANESSAPNELNEPNEPNEPNVPRSLPRTALLQAAFAAAAILPLPTLPLAAWCLGHPSWRFRAAPALLLLGATLAVVTWPWRGAVDIVAALVSALAAIALRPCRLADRLLIALLAALSLVAAFRAFLLLRS